MSWRGGRLHQLLVPERHIIHSNVGVHADRTGMLSAKFAATTAAFSPFLAAVHLQHPVAYAIQAVMGFWAKPAIAGCRQRLQPCLACRLRVCNCVPALCRWWCLCDVRRRHGIECCRSPAQRWRRHGQGLHVRRWHRQLRSRAAWERLCSLLLPVTAAAAAVRPPLLPASCAKTFPDTMRCPGPEAQPLGSPAKLGPTADQRL